MSKSDSERLEDQAPSYEEAIASSVEAAISPYRGSRIQSAVDAVRNRRVQDILGRFIEPYLFPQVLDGVSRFILILIPSEHEQMTISEQNIVSIPSSPIIARIIHLKTQEYKSQFCLQASVLRAIETLLETSLKDFLSPSGATVKDSSHNTKSMLATPPLPAVGTEPPRGSSWSRKKSGTAKEEHDPTRSTRHLRGGWRADDEDLRGTKLGPNDTRVLAKLRDVSFRTESAMGLLCTETIKAVWIDIEIGA